MQCYVVGNPINTILEEDVYINGEKNKYGPRRKEKPSVSENEMKNSFPPDPLKVFTSRKDAEEYASSFNQFQRTANGGMCGNGAMLFPSQCCAIFTVTADPLVCDKFQNPPHAVSFIPLRLSETGKTKSLDELPDEKAAYEPSQELETTYYQANRSQVRAIAVEMAGQPNTRIEINKPLIAAYEKLFANDKQSPADKTVATQSVANTQSFLNGFDRMFATYNSAWYRTHRPAAQALHQSIHQPGLTLFHIHSQIIKACDELEKNGRSKHDEYGSMLDIAKEKSFLPEGRAYGFIMLFQKVMQEMPAVAVLLIFDYACMPADKPTVRRKIR